MPRSPAVRCIHLNAKQRWIEDIPIDLVGWASAMRKRIFYYDSSLDGEDVLAVEAPGVVRVIGHKSNLAGGHYFTAVLMEPVLEG
jgi:hypothetical protein